MKKENPKKDKPRAGKYEDKLAVKGSFLDIMKASVKHADSKAVKKKP